jgi:signal transduction histidine kinase
MKPFSSLRNRILLVILLAIVPLLLVVIEDYRQEYAAALARIDEDILDRLRVTLMKEKEVANTIQLTLRIMGNAEEMRTPTPAACSGLAQRLTQSQLKIGLMGAVDADGTMFCSSRGIPDPINFADRRWFREAYSSKGFSQGEYIIGRATKIPQVAYGFAQLSPQGEVQNVLFMGVPLDWFYQVIEGIRIPPGWQALVVSETGMIAANVKPTAAIFDTQPESLRAFLVAPPRAPEVRRVKHQDREYIVGLAPLPSTQSLTLMIGTNLDTAVAPVQRRLVNRLLLVLIIALPSMLFAWYAVRGGVLRWAELMGAAVERLGSGHYNARIGTASDIAELQVLTESFDAMATRIENFKHELEDTVALRTASLARNNAELESFAYSVSHDLRAPLRAVIGFATILTERHRHALDSEGQRYLDNIHSAATRMEDLIEDLLHYVRAGRNVIQTQPVALEPVIRRVATLFEPQLTHGGHIEITSPLATVQADERLLEEIITNLLDNALKYQPPGQAPLVHITTAEHAGAVALAVTDNGIGIAPEYHTLVFNLFQRLHSEADYPGTGMGLAIAAKCARLLDATLTVASTPGRGSTFTLHLRTVAANTGESL